MKIKPRIWKGTLAFAAMALVSCGGGPEDPGLEFMPDMYRSPSYETYQASDFFKDSVTALEPVKGTIPRGYDTYFAYPNTNEGYEAAGTELRSPLTADSLTLAHGKRLYDINCKHCHGAKGDGKGTLLIKGDPFPVPSYFDANLADLPEGKMYFSITYGKNLMGPHGNLVNPQERWQIIAYIKDLQQQHKDAGSAPADTTATASN